MIAPIFKKLFPEKTDSEILYDVYNPCEHCDFYECQNCAFNKALEEFKKKGIEKK